MSIILDSDERIASLTKSFYARMLSLGSKVNSQIAGGPFATIVAACAQIISDAWDDLIGLLSSYNPNTSTGVAQKQVLGFFELEPIAASVCRQKFTILRKDAASPLVVSSDATIQTQRLPSGEIYTHKMLDAGFTMAADTFFAVAEFESVQVGAATTITYAQPMDVVSGVSGVQVVAGSYEGSDTNPLSTMTGTIGAWVTANSDKFVMRVTKQGRDAETDTEFYDRCVARWSEQSTGSTASAYESWVEGFVSSTGSTPVLRARVTENQVFNPAVSTWPAGQLPAAPTASQEFVMGVEVAVALRSGLAATPAFFQELGAYMLSLIPQTDKVWFRPPSMVTLGPGSVTITMRGGGSYSDLAYEVARSFFIFDEAYPKNYSGLGDTVYKSDLVFAIRSLSTSIEDVKVVFSPTDASKLDADGNLKLAEFDQVSMTDPENAIVVVSL